MASRVARACGGPFAPGIIFGGLLLALACHAVWPLNLPGRNSASLGAAETTFGILFIVAWLLIGLAASTDLWRHQTALRPTLPTAHLVTTGMYAFSRNPVYVGLISMQLGAALLFHSIWPCLFLVIELYLLSRFVVDREEVYLNERFGEEYRTYQQKTRRWL